MNIAVLTRPSRYSFFQGLKKVVKSSLNEKRWTKAKKINRKIFAKVTGASRNHHTKNSIGSLAKYRERAGVFIYFSLSLARFRSKLGTNWACGSFPVMMSLILVLVPLLPFERCQVGSVRGSVRSGDALQAWVYR